MSHVPLSQASDTSLYGSKAQVLSEAGGRVAVRSSAVGQDSARASFAGQFTTELNITSVASRSSAIQAIARSGQSQASELYRIRLGISGPLRMAIVVQQFVRSEVAGVLFTQDPLTQKDTCRVEASWGNCEVVVSGRVTPDSFRLDSQGRVCERRTGLKDVQVQPCPTGGMEELQVAIRHRQDDDDVHIGILPCPVRCLDSSKVAPTTGCAR